MRPLGLPTGSRLPRKDCLEDVSRWSMAPTTSERWLLLLLADEGEAAVQLGRGCQARRLEEIRFRLAGRRDGAPWPPSPRMYVC